MRWRISSKGWAVHNGATAEHGYLTKDLALLMGVDQRWLSTKEFLDKISENLTKAMAG